ncbi:MAG: CPBP family intramembrane metalloprotease, partial [Bacteroidia bacterium]|nr:CPBP family intramembrane metalloprotease [Bacteroidia bacterium]
YMCFPLLVALVLQKINGEKPSSTGLLKFNLSWAWLVALLIPVAAVLLCTLISGLMPGVHLEYGPDQLVSQFGLDDETSATLASQFEAMPPAVMLLVEVLSGLIAGCTINALFAFGEEYGWRNYMVKALEGSGFWKKAVFIGLVWGIWHAPLILQGHNYPQHPVAGVALMCVFCILLGIIELYFVLKTGSVFPAAIIHGTTNAMAGLVLFFAQGGNDLTVGLTGAAGFLTYAIICAAIYLYDRFVSRDMIMS